MPTTEELLREAALGRIGVDRRLIQKIIDTGDTTSVLAHTSVTIEEGAYYDNFALIIQHLLFQHWLLIPIIVIAVISYVASLIGVFILGFIIDALATSFDAEKNAVQAMKLAVYSYTAGWVAGTEAGSWH